MMADDVVFSEFTEVRTKNLTVTDQMEADKVVIKSGLKNISIRLKSIFNSDVEEPILEFDSRRSRISLKKPLFVNGVLISCPVGMVIPFVLKGEPPSGWILCDGRTVDRAIYPKLYDVVGPNVPNLIEKFIVGTSGLCDLKSSNSIRDSFNINWNNIESFMLTINQKTIETYGLSAGNSSANFEFLKGNEELKTSSIDFYIGENKPLQVQHLLPKHYKTKFIIKAI